MLNPNKNLHLNINCHGVNLGTFFELPKNVKVLIPYDLDETEVNIDTEICMAIINCLNIDEKMSNIIPLLQKYVFNTNSGLDSFMMYDGTSFNGLITGSNMCPNIKYTDDNKSFRSGIAECPIDIKQNISC